MRDGSVGVEREDAGHVLELALFQLAPDGAPVRAPRIDRRVPVHVGRIVPRVLEVRPAQVRAVGRRQEASEPDVEEVVRLELRHRAEHADAAVVAVVQVEVALEFEQRVHLAADVRAHVERLDAETVVRVGRGGGLDSSSDTQADADQAAAEQAAEVCACSEPATAEGIEAAGANFAAQTAAAEETSPRKVNPHD